MIVSCSAASLRAFFKYAEAEKLISINPAENLSLPRRSLILPKNLSGAEIGQLLAPPLEATPDELCVQAILELAYASGLRLAELRGIRLEQLQLEDGFVTIIGKGNKERVVPMGVPCVEAMRRYLDAGRPKLVKHLPLPVKHLLPKLKAMAAETNNFRDRCH